MEKPPQFIREFSKEISPEERQQLAQEIETKRAKYFAKKYAQTENQREIQQSTSERERVLTEKFEMISKLENKIAELSISRLGKVLNYFQLRKLQADISIGQRTYEQLKQEQDIGINKEQEISRKLELEETSPEMQEIRTMLDDFYKGQKEKWAESKHTKEDITKYFSEENLASLSLEDYALLLKRFPREMVTHVTRQGIRDHLGHVYHTVGEGAYTDNFMKMVEDGRLRSPLGIYLTENKKEQAIAEFLHLNTFENKEEAMNYLATFAGTKQKESGGYADSMAVHFATEEVADVYYGSEKNNEIFIAYPSAYIASQYYFSGQLTESGGGYWNDQWVWANEERGMDLNAGLIFIPGEVKVDRKTGSRYELDENKNPVKNSKYQAALRRVVDSADFHDFANQVMKITGKLDLYQNESNLSSKDRELLEKLEPFRQKLEQEFDITDRRLQSALLRYGNLFRINAQKEDQEKGKGTQFSPVDSEIENALQNEGILFLEAKDMISSKEFWETHFTKNPEKRPSKVVYYKGADPTDALLQWRKKQGITKKTEGENIGFSERHIKRDMPQAIVGLDRFGTLAEKVIKKYFEDS